MRKSKITPAWPRRRYLRWLRQLTPEERADYYDAIGEGVFPETEDGEWDFLSPVREASALGNTTFARSLKELQAAGRVEKTDEKLYVAVAGAGRG